MPILLGEYLTLDLIAILAIFKQVWPTLMYYWHICTKYFPESRHLKRTQSIQNCILWWCEIKDRNISFFQPRKWCWAEYFIIFRSGSSIQPQRLKRSWIASNKSYFEAWAFLRRHERRPLSASDGDLRGLNRSATCLFQSLSSLRPILAIFEAGLVAKR